MAQKTDLNISPYYDDFDSSKNFYKVLFKPGFPVQARELTTLQSILQGQIEDFGSHMFKEGSMVIPGNVSYDDQFYAVKLDNTKFGIDISVYIKNFIGKIITGLTSGSTATIQHVAFPEESDDVDHVTIYVKYVDSDNNYEFNEFLDGESFFASEDVVYGNTTIPAGTIFADAISLNSTSIGSAISIAEGIYFIRGYFVNVESQTIVLDYYTNNPSYRVGLKVDEILETAKDDSSLYDPAKGFTNFAAPGADRLKINLTLTKKSLDDLTDTDFVEVLRVDNGEVKKIIVKTDYNIIRDYLAKRTFDESGNYSIDEYDVTVDNSLNNGIDSDGLFFASERTDQGNEPSEDLMCIKVSPGKAYVQGYDVESVATTILDVEKPRSTQTIDSANIPFEMGNILRVNNVSGVPSHKKTIELYNQHGGNGIRIGDARVYTFNLTDAAYENNSTNWDLYLYDIQTYTTLILNRTVNSDELPATSYVKGKSSGASGYLASAANGKDHINLRQTSGTFISGEQIIVNGLDSSATINSVNSFGTREIKSVKQPTSVSGFNNDFVADTLLDSNFLPNSVSQVTISAGVGGVSQVTSPGKVFTGIKTDSIIRYSVAGLKTETFNRVSGISEDGLTMELSGISTVSGVFIGGLPTSEINPFINIGAPIIRNEQSGQLYEILPDTNISTINLSSSTLSVSEQITGETTNGSGVLVFDVTQTGLSTSFFKSFDQERFSVHYDASGNGGIGTITSDAFVLSGGSDEATISGLRASQSDVIVNVTSDKQGIQSKIKQYTRSASLNVNLSANPESGTAENTSINDGLTYNKFYGLRVQDQEISLNFPDVVKVLAIYESLNTSNPTPDRVQFSASADVTTNAIVGENIVGQQSGAIARVLSKTGVPSNNLDIIYLNENKFVAGEQVKFEESNISTDIQALTLGLYNDVTNSYTLDKGQREQYYDYSRIVRNRGEKIPSKILLVIFDHYTVPASDSGDVFSILSYDQDRFAEDIPTIGPNEIRASDTLDFRPRVSEFTSTTASPFDFSARSFDTSPKLIVKPNESSIIGYENYLGRIDKVYLDKYGSFKVVKGTSGNPLREPLAPNDVMEVATIELPPYLYNPEDAEITVTENRRYTMRDIGQLEDRIEQLETVTSLSFLELGTEVLQIQDAEGRNRFKSGFFVDDFNNASFIAQGSSGQINTNQFEPIRSSEVLNFELASAVSIPENELDNSIDYELLDSNVKKTGELVTLDYSDVGWIEQALATRVENVNPFHVVTYNGTVKLTPKSDTWVRTIRLGGRISTNTRFVADVGRRGQARTRTSSRDVVVASGAERFMRSRGVQFVSKNLKPLTRFYQFLDGNGSVDFVPKLLEISGDSSLENYGSIGTFQVGETVIGYTNSSNRELIRFRVATSNHKEGPYNNPSNTFNINPYVKSENISSGYSPSSKILNVDTASLADISQTRYDGYVLKGMILVGQSSGAYAFVKDVRLVSDNYGDLIGSFFLRNPLGSPTPSVRIRTGTKTYRLTNSPTNATPLRGSKLTSSAQVAYRSTGRFEVRQRVTTVNRTQFYDPLAQSFSVGGNVEAPNLLGFNDDDDGAFLTAVDLYFANKPAGNDEVRVEIRTVELGTPTRTIIGNPVVLQPGDIQTSRTGEVATKATFDYPIYLAPGEEYAIVLVAETSDEYEVWIAQMGERTVNTQSLPDAESVRYTKQFALGSLFKSQNGSIWTANQYQDLKFKLYKANFTSSTGTAFFYNPPLNQYANDYLQNNPLVTLPKQATLGITTVSDTNLIGILTAGRKLAGSEPYVSATVVGQGSSVSTVSVAFSGSNYTADSSVDTFAITGQGTGLKLSINTDSDGKIIGVPTAVTAGNGYSVGDVVGITTSTVSSNTGRDARITIGAITGLDTLYLSNIQGNTFTVGAGVSYYNNSGTIVSMASTLIRTYNANSNEYSGNYLQVNHFNHAMHASNNKLVINGAESNIAPTTLSTKLESDEVSTISVGSTANFDTFEGVSVSASNPGYVIIKPGDEIISYSGVGAGTLSIASGGRGIGTSVVIPHEINSEVYKYEMNGVSLRRINTTHDISSLDIRMDNYYVEIDRSANGTDRSSDASLAGAPELSFADESTLGGDSCKVSRNIQFTEVTPNAEIFTPGNTSANATIRTVTGTSVDGSEVSFLDNGFEPIEMNSNNVLNSTRIVCSKTNEDAHLDGLPRNKSLTLGITMQSDNPNLSPYIFTDTANIQLDGYRVNNPITDLSKDNRVKSINNDPHEAVYVSNDIFLANPATSLKVLVSAYRHESADIRVLYKLIRADSQEVDQEFELFPGYDNLLDTDNDGFGDKIIDSANNSGRSDAFVRSSLDNEYREYQFTADNLDLFTGYAIKIVLSGTNQAYAPKIRELRTIAVRW